MLDLPPTLILPLKMDEQGDIRVSGTRVTLHTLLSAYQQGETPESIHEGFPTVPLADIHAVIAYYLANQESVDAYLRQVDEAGERNRTFWETRRPPPTKAELLARLDAKKRKGDEA